MGEPKPATEAEAQAVWDAVNRGDSVPEGFAFDPGSRTPVTKTTPEQEQAVQDELDAAEEKKKKEEERLAKEAKAAKTTPEKVAAPAEKPSGS